MPDVKIPSKDPNLDWTVVTVKSEKPDLREKEKPLVDLKVTNPITYIKSWWKKIIGNDGIELKVKVKPLTAIAIAIIVVTVTFGIGTFKLPVYLPFFEYSQVNSTLPTPTVMIDEGGIILEEIKRDTAFTGVLRESNGKFYLMIPNSEAVNLVIQSAFDSSSFVSKRVFVEGSYMESTRTLYVHNLTNIKVVSVNVESSPTNTVVTTTKTLTPTPGYGFTD